MKSILAGISLRQRITIVVVALIVGAGIYALVQQQKEGDFRPLFTGVSPEDAAGIVQKLKEAGVEYRLPETGGAILVPSAHLAELRLSMAAAGLPKTGRIGFELFDKANLGATEFTEHVNYSRALEGELERSVMSLDAVESARVHITFPKESVFLDSQQAAKASVLVKLRPGTRLSPQNVLAIDHLMASSVEGLSPDGVSVLDMNGNLLGRPRSQDTLDGPGPSEATLDFRHKVEADLLVKINSTLEPLLGAENFRAAASVDCDFSGGEQSEELFDPARSVMLSSQRSEDASGSSTANGVPGTASTLPKPTSRPGAGSAGVSRVTENVTYQSSRTVKKTRLPAGAIRKMSLAVLVDQDVTWVKDKNAYRKVLVPPTPEKLKVIQDLVAGVTGLDTQRGDQVIVETLPFETTRLREHPDENAQAPAKPAPATLLSWPPKLDRNTLIIGGVALVVLLLLIFVVAKLLGGGKKAPPQVRMPAAALAAPADDEAAGTALVPGLSLEQQLAEREALQEKMDAQALSSLKLSPVITKTAEVFAKHLREKIKKEPEISAQVLHSWIREDES